MFFGELLLGEVLGGGILGGAGIVRGGGIARIFHIGAVRFFGARRVIVTLIIDRFVIIRSDRLQDTWITTGQIL